MRLKKIIHDFYIDYMNELFTTHKMYVYILKISYLF